jgi:uncharacterized protein
LNTLLLHLDTIKQLAAEKENENDAFRFYLKQQDAAAMDKKVQQLNASIAPKIDCTACGNCCKSLLINVTEQEAINLAAHLKLPTQTLQEKYLEVSPGGKMVISSVPCHFLNSNKCSIYEHRFEGCREFPHLDRDNFTQRLFGTMMYYGTCPIIFNVVEALKKEVGFIHNQQ